MYAQTPPSVTRKLLRQLLDFLLPSPCLACQQPVSEPRGSLGLCPGCRERLVRWPSSVCAACGQALAGASLPEGYCCGECRRQAPPTTGVLSVWSYQPPIDAVLAGLKFQRLDYLGAHIGRELAEVVRRRLEGDEVVVPIPLHWRRYVGRGYNQAAMIARPLAKALELPLRQPLGRSRSTPAQSTLPRVARQANLLGAFKVRRPGSVRGRHVLVVDDVITTGATLRAAAACLLEAGAEAVTGLSAARTPVSPIPPDPAI